MMIGPETRLTINDIVVLELWMCNQATVWRQVCYINLKGDDILLHNLFPLPLNDNTSVIYRFIKHSGS